MHRRALLAAAPTLTAAVAIHGRALSAPPALTRKDLVATGPGDIVETDHGRVRGYGQGGMHVFKGVPYASINATGRFEPAAQPTPWAGERLCIAAGPACPQVAPGFVTPASQFLLPRNFMFQAEDCLSLNIWTPGLDTRRRPVMVWIHGGEFSTGSNAELAVYDGFNLAHDGDVVIVSINHRLNVLGFLNLEGIAPGSRWAGAANLGMLDIVVALRWIGTHVERFGGDPGNITLFGQSGGGLKITTLMAMPSAAGLFHKAIVESGSQTEIFRPDVTQRFGRDLLDVMGLTPATADRLATVPVDRLIAAGNEATARSIHFSPIGKRVWSLVGWAPTLDGGVIPTDPYVAQNKAFASVPLLVGHTQHEFSPAVFLPALANISDADVVERLRPVAGDKAASIVELARTREPAATPALLYAEISTASFNGRNAVMQAQLKAAQGGASAWAYNFAWATPLLDGTPGAFHGSELPFVFRNTSICPTPGPGVGGLMDAVSGAWLSFARHGNPGWQPVTAGALPTMVFDTTSRVENDPGAALRHAVEAL